MNVDIPKELTHISLCAGYGGIDLGLTRALRSVRTVCFVEIQAYAIENLVKKIEAGHLDCAPIWSNLKTMPWHAFSGKVDILSGGFPCQPFSSAGRRAGDSDQRHLWPHILRGIRELNRPAIIFLENVEGILSAKLKGSEWADSESTPVLQHVLRELERVGYQATAGIFSASEVGAPHQRKRVFIFAIRADLTQAGLDLIRGQLRTDEPQSIYPAGRGAEQYAWEPSRLVMANSCSSSSTNKRAIIHKNRGDMDRAGQGLQSQWAAQNSHIIDTGREGMAHATCRQTQSRIEQYEILHIENEERQTGKPARKSDFITSTGNETKHIEGAFKSEMGRNINGAACWMGNEELYTSCDNRTDELRLLGNGVVPDTAARAFKVLFNRLTK